MILHSVRNGDEQFYHSLNISNLGGAEGSPGVGLRVSWVRTGQDGPGEVPDGGDDGGEVVSAIPETIVGGLIAEDQHQADDDGEGGNLACNGLILVIEASVRASRDDKPYDRRRKPKIRPRIHIQVHNKDSKEGMQHDGY